MESISGFKTSELASRCVKGPEAEASVSAEVDIRCKQGIRIGSTALAKERQSRWHNILLFEKFYFVSCVGCGEVR